MSLLETPERAIQSFERLHGLRVTVHDLGGTLWPFLSQDRFMHRHALCQAVKVTHSHACMEFDITQLRREIDAHTEGRVQVCFAGLVEFVVPVFRKGVLDCVLFAGPRLLDKGLTQITRDAQPKPVKKFWPVSMPLPALVGETEAQDLLEALRQLAARLERFYSERDQSGARSTGENSPNYVSYRDATATRRTAIQRFILNRHTEPVRLLDLARALDLSEGRTAHAVRESCGKTFVELLTETRLRTACGLLRHTRLSILETAVRSGFGDLSHFHRCFRTAFTCTPLQFRKRGDTA